MFIAKLIAASLANVRRTGSTFPALQVPMEAAGEYTDPFKLQYVAGHDNINTTIHTLQPRGDRSRNCLCGWDTAAAGDSCRMQRSVQNPVQMDTPSDAGLAKILSTWLLQRAEVVELADTPS